MRLLHTGAQLQHTARVASGNNIRLRRHYVLHFACQDLHRHLVVGDVIDPRSPTAKIRISHRHQLQFWDALQEFPRLLPNTLSV